MTSIVLTGLGMCLGAVYEDGDAVADLKTTAERLLGVPSRLLRLTYQSKELLDSQPLHLSSFATVEVGLRLNGGVVDPVLRVIAYKTVASLICRKCYSRNGVERTTCRKCGWTDLRRKKHNAKELQPFYKPRN